MYSPIKTEAFEKIYPGMPYDTALPQDWLNQFKGEDYHTILSGTCWGYPSGCIFGIPCPVTVQADWLLGKQSEASILYRKRAMYNAPTI